MTRPAGGAAGEYALRRETDWSAFRAQSGPPGDYWATWAERSNGWRPAMLLLQPLGRDRPDLLEPLRPLLDALADVEGVELPPPSFVHLPTLVVGYLMSTDISFTDMENIAMQAAGRIQRLAPFTLRFSGISATEETLYLGVDDGYALREVRLAAAERAPRIAEALREEGEAAGGQDFVPTVPFAYFMGGGDRARIAELVEPYRETVLGEHHASHIGLGRLLCEPQIRYPGPDVLVEIPLRGK